MAHATNDIRTAFEEGIYARTIDQELLSRLWHCTDVMPSSLCDELDLPLGSTYARAVQRLRRKQLPWENSSVPVR